MFKKILRVIFISASIALLAACGMKGPLEHPKLTHLDKPSTLPATIAKI